MDGVTEKLLGVIALPADGVADIVPQLRDQYGADLVSVIAAGRAAGGLGYTPPAPGPSTAAWGYRVVGRGAIGNHSMGYEIGHNLSADHDRVTRPVQSANGATGYFPSKGDWSSLMAYEPICRKATKGTCTRINRFTNPKQKYRGEPIGIPLGKPDHADSSDVLSKTGGAVAAYRAAKASAAMCAVTSSVSPAGAGIEDMQLTAVFEQRRHALKVACEGGSGTVSLSRDGPYSDGDTVLATACPTAGTCSWTGCSTESRTAATRTGPSARRRSASTRRGTP
ncbi:hypothetical protein ACIBG6_06730 [Streptomyces sp. NPDC050842]|uniref:hypothetical protein n=1 Tax=Streptomyces sp. NPDC050842 TaxID=3365636 RepID=UPI0037BD4FE4